MNRTGNTKPIGMAIVGVGRLGERMAKGISEVADTELVGVYDIDEDKARSFGSAHRGLVVYESLDALLTDGRVSAVVFCTPPACHAEQVTVALSAGKHVLLEKPLAHTLDDARQIRDAARRHNHLVAMVGSALLTFLPALQIVRRWLQEGRLGKPYLVRAVYNHLAAPAGWFQDPAISGGGSLIDLAYHPLTVFDYLLGGSLSFDLRFARVSSNVVFSVEDTVQLMVELNQSISAYLELCWGVSDPTRELEIVGDKGAAKIVFLEDKAQLFVGDTRLEPRCWPSHYIELTEKEIAHFANCITSSSAPQAGDFETAFRIHELIEAAYREGDKRVRSRTSQLSFTK